MTREENYINFFTQLTAENLEQINNFFSDDAHFKDPFNDVNGINAIKIVFKHMFETTDAPIFIVNHHAKNQDKLFIQWTFNFSKDNKPWSIEGSSMVTFNDANLINEHIDYWDPAEQIYGKIGVLKPFITFLRSRLTAS